MDDGKDSADELQDSRSSMLLNRQGSDTSNGSLVLPTGSNLPPLTHSYSSRTAHPDYISRRMEDHFWYAGQMDRESANQTLLHFPPGAFLVRCGRLGFALSLKTDHDVKHMKIDTQESSSAEDDNAYFFSENRKFGSIVELVSWYCRNSLKESFQGLDTFLLFPFKELFRVEATYDFRPNPEDANMLTLRQGERVTILDQLDGNGWWKAYNGSKIGYIPKTFVVKIEL